MTATIGKRVYSVFSILALGFLVVIAISWTQTQKTTVTFRELVNSGQARQVLIRKITQQSSYVQRNFYNILLTDDNESHLKFEKLISESRSLNTGFMKDEAELIHEPKVKSSFEKLSDVRAAYYVALEEALSFAMKGDKAKALALNNAKVRPAFLKYQDVLSAFADDVALSDKEEASAAEGNASTISNSVAAIGFAILVITLSLTIWQIRWVVGNLVKICNQLRSSSEHMTEASRDLASSSEELSSGATEGAASLEETVASMEELASMVKLNADNARAAAELSLSSSRSAELGESEISKLVAAVSEVAKSSKEIEEIITVIDDIAFQTNLLALNAAVEAARAGEQGKGFAVVAEAVRNLAQRSSVAAKDIAILIKGSVSKIDGGVKLADQSGKVLREIVTSVKKVVELNNEISSASQEQSTGLGQISKAMTQLDQVTQGNAGSAEKSAAASQQMSNQATSLLEMVNSLSLIVEGENPGVSSPTPKTDASTATVLQFSGDHSRSLRKSKRRDAKSQIPFGGEDSLPDKVGDIKGF